MLLDSLRSRGLDHYIEKTMRGWEIPGLALAVVEGDAVILAGGYGVRQVGGSAPVDERTVFAIGSTTKAFTAAALAMLVDEGRLGWDDPVTKHLPDFQMWDAWVTREITVRDLLTHRTGLPLYEAHWFGTTLSRDELVRRVHYLKPVSSFRSKADYQNAQYLVAGQIIPALTGQSWDEFIAGRIFKPLGMSASSTSIRALAGQANVAAPHARIENAVRPVAWRNLDNMAPAGAINSNAAEMAQWLRLQVGGGMYRGERLLSEAAMQEMREPQMLINTWERVAFVRQMLPMDSHFWTCGLGWFVTDFHGRRAVWHLGGIDGMSAAVGYLPEDGVGVAVLTNMDAMWGHNALLFWIFDACLNAPERDWSADFMRVRDAVAGLEQSQAQAMAAARVSGTQPSLPLAKYAGTYNHMGYEPATVTEAGGHLVAKCNPGLVGDLEHWHFDTFRVVWRDPILGKSYLTFALDSTGNVDRMSVALMDEQVVYERAPESA